MALTNRSILAFAAALVGFVVCSSLNAAPEPAASPRLSYNRDVRPILSDNCFFCHGFDKNHRDGKLRLDIRDEALAKKALVPGKPDESELVKRIFSADPDEQMPPAKAHKTLTDAQKQTLKQWIAEGAVYEPHWAYIPPKRWPVPAVKDEAWAKNPIDRFILATHESKNLDPSKEADRRTLLRRLSLDLIGIPPTPQEVQAFVDDKSPDAYAKQVDRLLASPHYGERMAVPWLDAVRFADTVGFHGDQNQNVFPYRDYVINAFNSDKPFDQFTVEQLAGDLLPNPTTEQLVATGFNRLNMMTREGGAQAKEYLAKYAADRVRTVGQAFLGSTFGCAECHDHKFDPISTKDFYSLSAFFADIKQWGIYTTYSYTPNPDLAGFTNDHPFPPEIVVESPYLKKREATLIKQMGRLARQKVRDPDTAIYSVLANAFTAQHRDGWVVLAPVDPATASADGSVALSGKAGANERVEFHLPWNDLKLASVATRLRLEVLPDDRAGGRITRGTAPSAVVQLKLWHKPLAGAETPVAVYYASADHREPRYANGYELLDVKETWRTSAALVKEAQTATYLLDKPLRSSEGDTLVLTLPKNTLGRIRVLVSPFTAAKVDDDVATALAWNAAGADPEEGLGRIASTFALSEMRDADLLKALRAVQREIFECRGGKSPSLIVQAWKPAVTRVLARGNWQDETGEIVEPATPHFLPGPKPEAGQRLTRLDLAKWIVSSDNPLTSRVIVNRLWKQYFGAGLYNSIEDIGFQGEPPSHPELLDWLAVEFRDSGWDVKHVVRLIVTSATYRQGSNLRREMLEIDPANRLLTSQSPRRLEAEFVRDNALAAAGLLNLDDIGGPSVFPYQPGGYYESIQFPSRDWRNETDERQYRRGVYTHWQRTFLHPMLANFDAPSREDAVCTRNVSNTPQQALTLLNDPEFVEAARVLAAHAMAASPEDAGRLSFIYERALAREPKANERESLAKFFATQREYFNGAPEDAAKLLKVGNAPAPSGVDEKELAAWTSVARVVLNLHETITRY